MNATVQGRVPDRDLPELLRQLRGADSVELKLTVAEEQQRSAVEALDMDPIAAEIRQVFFLDTPALDLYRHGLVVRARRAQRKGADAVVKLRPVVPDALPKALRRQPGFGVEVDAMPGGYVCSATMKCAADAADVRAAAKGERALRKLFSKEQRKFFAEHAPDGIDIDSLSVLGPILVLKLRFSHPDYARRLVAELWLYPDASRILELSTKCAPEDAFRAAAETRAFLHERGVDLDGAQETKTRRALEYFSAAARPDPPSEGDPP